MIGDDYSLVSLSHVGITAEQSAGVRFFSPPKKRRVGRGDPRNLIQPFLPGSVVGEASMQPLPGLRKLRKYMYGNCTFVTKKLKVTNRQLVSALEAAS